MEVTYQRPRPLLSVPVVFIVMKMHSLHQNLPNSLAPACLAHLLALRKNNEAGNKQDFIKMVDSYPQ